MWLDIRIKVGAIAFHVYFCARKIEIIRFTKNVNLKLPNQSPESVTRFLNPRNVAQDKARDAANN